MAFIVEIIQFLSARHFAVDDSIPEWCLRWPLAFIFQKNPIGNLAFLLNNQTWHLSSRCQHNSDLMRVPRATQLFQTKLLESIFSRKEPKEERGKKKLNKLFHSINYDFLEEKKVFVLVGRMSCRLTCKQTRIKKSIYPLNHWLFTEKCLNAEGDFLVENKNPVGQQIRRSMSKHKRNWSSNSSSASPPPRMKNGKRSRNDEQRQRRKIMYVIEISLSWSSLIWVSFRVTTEFRPKALVHTKEPSMLSSQSDRE